ncbi:hypothetical protein, partial [Salmonella enterica]|uniref:hypothetical protein n=1 Tax=Salmonella enterica TaxID=28901 RepID=UPI001CB7F3FF
VKLEREAPVKPPLMPTSGITTAWGRRVDTLKIFIPAAMFARHKSDPIQPGVIGAASLEAGSGQKTERSRSK